MLQTKTPLGTYAHHVRHWHYVKKRRSIRKLHTTRELFMGQTVSVLGALAAGYILDLSKDQLLVFAGTLLILPGVFDLGGSVAGAMGARIAHRLDTGAPARIVLRDGILHAFFLSVVAGALLGLFGAAIAAAFAEGSFLNIWMLVWLSCVVCGAIGFPLVAFFTYFSHKKGLDPDNIIGPIETTLFDILSLVAITVIVKVVF